MGVEARCCPSKSSAHLCHMKKQPFLCNGCPCRGSHHCHRRCHLHCCCQLHRRHRCYCHRHCRRNHPLPLLLPLAIAVAVAVNHCHHYLCCIAVSHCCCHRPCCWPLPSPSPSAIAVAIAVGHHHRHAVGHFQDLLPWRGNNCIQSIEANNAYLILLCSDSGWRIDRSWMTDKVSSCNGQHLRWAASSKQ
jgi:hypothetical protein